MTVTAAIPNLSSPTFWWWTSGHHSDSIYPTRHFLPLKSKNSAAWLCWLVCPGQCWASAGAPPGHCRVRGSVFVLRWFRPWPAPAHRMGDWCQGWHRQRPGARAWDGGTRDSWDQAGTLTSCVIIHKHSDGHIDSDSLRITTCVNILFKLNIIFSQPLFLSSTDGRSWDEWPLW